MKRLLAAAALVLLLAVVRVSAEYFGEAPPLEAADLAQCYAWAKAQSEGLHVQEEQIYQLQQQYRQVLGAVLPNLSYNYSAKYQDTSGNHASGGGVNSVVFQGSQPQANFVLTQPIFTGFKELAGMRAFKHEEKAGRLHLQHAYASLYRDISNAFYLTVNLETQLGDIASAIAMSASRSKELRAWVDLGKSRHSEVVLVESQEAAYEAQAEALRGQIDVARELLSFLTGKDMHHAKLLDQLPRTLEFEAEELVLGRAVTRTDVRALRETVDAQESLVTVSRAGWYPTAAFVGDYYNYRVSFYRPVHWDAAINVNLPIFAGGATVAGIRQAKSQVEQAWYNFEFGLRQARSQIHSAYVTLRAAVAQSVAAEKSYRKADESYRFEQKEYRLGLVSNLDVLAALNAALNAKLIYDQTMVQSKLDLLLLKVSDEELPLP